MNGIPVKVDQDIVVASSRNELLGYNVHCWGKLELNAFGQEGCDGAEAGAHSRDDFAVESNAAQEGVELFRGFGHRHVHQGGDLVSDSANATREDGVLLKLVFCGAKFCLGGSKRDCGAVRTGPGCGRRAWGHRCSNTMTLSR